MFVYCFIARYRSHTKMIFCFHFVFDRTIGRQTEPAHDKLGCDHKKNGHSRDGNRLVRFFPVLSLEPNGRHLAHTGACLHMHENSISRNETAASRQPVRTQQICADCTRTRATMTNVHIPTRPRTYILSTLFLTLIRRHRHSACV